jgi:uncharacterized membrane protein
MNLHDLESLAPGVFLLLIVAMPIALWFSWRTFDNIKGARKIMVVLTRLIVLGLLAAAAAEVRAWRDVPEDKLCVMALLDVSNSVPDTALEKAVPEIEALFKKGDAQHVTGLILYAGQARLAITPDQQPLGAAEIKNQIAKVRRKEQTDPGLDLALGRTNVEYALDLASSVFPGGYGRRIVLFTDGNANEGRTAECIARCRSAGIDVFTSTLSHDDAPFDVAVASLSVPTSLTANISFDVTVRMSAQAACEAKLALYRNGCMIEVIDKLELNPGSNTKVFHQQLDSPGAYVYQARLSCDKLQQSVENDVAYGFTSVKRNTKVLVTGKSEFEAQHLVSALRRGGMECEFRSPDGIPDRLIDLIDFDVLVMNSLPASSFPVERQQLVRDYVELFGGGLLEIGLDAAGGYVGSPLEEALPVSSDPARLGKLSTSVVLIADTSKSIILADLNDGKKAKLTNDPSTDNARTELDRPAIIRQTAQQIVHGMSETDYFGLINFGSEIASPKWVVRPQKVYDSDRITADIEKGLQTKPAIPDPDALAEWIKREANPGVEMAPAALADALLKCIDANRLPHMDTTRAMQFLRTQLKAKNNQMLPNAMAEGLERFIRPNAFLSRSNVFRSIVQAAQELQQRETASKRIILLSDGYFEGNYDYAGIAGQLAADGISFSTIALKDTDAHLVMLETLSRWGVGHHYEASSLSHLDTDLKKELELASRPRVLETTFRARKLGESPLLHGLDVGLAPPLFGYVRSSPKLGANTVLGVPPDYEPLLATWQFGAGRATAFTSDAHERWATLWVRNWSLEYDRFWCGIVESLRGGSITKRLTPQVDLTGHEISVSVDVTSRDGSFVNAEPMSARFYSLGEDGYLFSRTSAVEMPMTQVAPGRYTAKNPNAMKGIYLVRIGAREANEIVTVGSVVATSAEDVALCTGTDELKQWASLGGGKSDAAPDTWANLTGKTRSEKLDLSHLASIVAAFVLMFDVLLRRWPAVATLFRRSEPAQTGN